MRAHKCTCTFIMHEAPVRSEASLWFVWGCLKKCFHLRYVFLFLFYFFLNLREENEHPVQATGVWSTDLAENCMFFRKFSEKNVTVWHLWHGSSHPGTCWTRSTHTVGLTQDDFRRFPGWLLWFLFNFSIKLYIYIYLIMDLPPLLIITAEEKQLIRDNRLTKPLLIQRIR